MVFSPIDSGHAASRFASNCWPAVARLLDPRELPRPGTAPTAALRWLSFTDSPPGSSRCAPTSTLHNAAFIPEPSTCLPQANALVCPFHDHYFSDHSGKHLRSHSSLRVVITVRIQPNFCSMLGRSSSAFLVPKRHSIPIASVRRKRQRLPSSLLIENASAEVCSI